MIKVVKSAIDVPLIVGGGIRTYEDAKEVVQSGADIIVTGTAIERAGSLEESKKRLESIIKGVKEVSP